MRACMRVCVGWSLDAVDSVFFFVFFHFWYSHHSNFFIINMFLSSGLIDIAYFITCSLWLWLWLSLFLLRLMSHLISTRGSCKVVFFFFVRTSIMLCFYSYFNTTHSISAEKKYPKWVIIMNVVYIYTSNKRKNLVYLYLSLAHTSHNTHINTFIGASVRSYIYHCMKV